MAVSKTSTTPAEPRLARLAELLGVAIDGQKRRGVTKQQIASVHGTHGSNLSAFVTSKGKVRNVAVGVVEAVLLDLGLHPNGLLTHGVHRWDLLDSRENVEGLGEILCANTPRNGPSHHQPHLLHMPVDVPPIAFVLHMSCAATLLLTRICADDIGRIEKSLGFAMHRREIDVGDATEIQSCWQLQEHEWVIPRSITRIMNWPLEA